MDFARTGFLTCCFLIAWSGCSSAARVEAIPPGMNLNDVPHQTIEMTAQRFHFTPEDLHAKMGTLVELKIRSLDGTHGFTLNQFGIDVSIEEGETKTVSFFAKEKGEFGFHCSHFCGIGHFGMTGKIIVE
jgi:heme/copper-type cytochrome/quinol oxidase subunit 2